MIVISIYEKTYDSKSAGEKRREGAINDWTVTYWTYAF